VIILYVVNNKIYGNVEIIAPIIKVIPKIGCLITPKESIELKKFKFNGFNAETPTNTFRSPPANKPSSQSINVITKVIPIEINEFRI